MVCVGKKLLQAKIQTQHTQESKQTEVQQPAQAPAATAGRSMSITFKDSKSTAVGAFGESDAQRLVAMLDSQRMVVT